MHSAHIYDIYKLLDNVTIDDEMRKLAIDVAAERKPHSRSLSVQDGMNIITILKEIISKNIYHADYDNITSALLFEKVDYDTAIQSLIKITESNLFTEPA